MARFFLEGVDLLFGRDFNCLYQINFQFSLFESNNSFDFFFIFKLHNSKFIIQMKKKFKLSQFESFCHLKP